MKMTIKCLTLAFLSLCVVASAQPDNLKQAGLENAVKRIVELSQFLGSIHANQCESIASSVEFFGSRSFTANQNRIIELMDVRDITSELMNRIFATEDSSMALISEMNKRVDVAYFVGEEIYYGVSLPSVLSEIETIDELPDLLMFSSKVTEIVSEETSEVFDSVPNIYRNIGRPQIYQEVMNKLHNDFRESTTTPDGGGFNESGNDATPI